jgi:hypothetical protein
MRYVVLVESVLMRGGRRDRADGRRVTVDAGRSFGIYRTILN